MSSARQIAIARTPRCTAWFAGWSKLAGNIFRALSAATRCSYVSYGSVPSTYSSNPWNASSLQVMVRPLSWCQNSSCESASSPSSSCVSGSATCADLHPLTRSASPSATNRQSAMGHRQFLKPIRHPQVDELPRIVVGEVGGIREEDSVPDRQRNVAGDRPVEEHVRLPAQIPIV